LLFSPLVSGVGGGGNEVSEVAGAADKKGGGIGIGWIASISRSTVVARDSGKDRNAVVRLPAAVPASKGSASSLPDSADEG
jgi:hypothetical protein